MYYTNLFARRITKEIFSFAIMDRYWDQNDFSFKVPSQSMFKIEIEDPWLLNSLNSSEILEYVL